MAARVCRVPWCVLVDEGEVMGIHEPLPMIILIIIFEFDSKIIFNTLWSTFNSSLEMESLYLVVKQYFQTLVYFFLNLVRRATNYVTHGLARVTRNFSSPYCWVERVSIFCGWHSGYFVFLHYLIYGLVRCQKNNNYYNLRLKSHDFWDLNGV